MLVVAVVLVVVVVVASAQELRRATPCQVHRPTRTPKGTPIPSLTLPYPDRSPEQELNTANSNLIKFREEKKKHADELSIATSEAAVLKQQAPPSTPHEATHHSLP